MSPLGRIVSAMEHDAPSVITTGEAATLLHVGRTTVHRMVADGTLEPIRKAPGRLGAYLFNRSDVDSVASRRAAALAAKLDAMRAGGAA